MYIYVWRSRLKYYRTILLVLALVVFSMTGCEKVIDVVKESEISPMDDPEAFTLEFVQGAVDLYKTHGIEATAAHYGNPDNIEGQWYVFITDENDLFVAHPLAPEFVGQDIKHTLSVDGLPVGKDIAAATNQGHWTEYLWPNPESNKLANKRTWSIRYDRHLFASGYYEPWAPDPDSLLTASKDDPEAYAQSLVLSAIAKYESEGLEATGTYYNDPARIDGQWYVFITDPNDIFVSHPVRQDFIGTDLKDVVGSDGYELGIEIAKATGTGLWIDYLWPNPASGNEEQKRTWAIRHEGYLFGTGYYEPIATESQ